MNQNNQNQSKIMLNDFIKQRNFEFIAEQHPKIKQIKGLLNLTTQNPQKLFVAEGIWAQQKILETQTAIESLIVCPEFIYTDEALEILKKLANLTKNRFVVSQRIFSKLSDRDKPDGLMTIACFPQPKIDEFSPNSNAVVLVLDGIELPGNVGTMLRMCDGAGADALFVCNRKARLTHPKLIKASMGAVLTVPIFEFDDVQSCKKWLLEKGFCIYLADTRATKFYFEEEFGKKTALVMGCERYGISKQWYGDDVTLISIPMQGKCDSLNVGVAATVLTYEAAIKNKLIAKR